MQLVQDPGNGISVVGMIKMGNIVPRAGIEPTCLTFRGQCATITPHSLADVTIIVMIRSIFACIFVNQILEPYLLSCYLI